LSRSRQILLIAVAVAGLAWLVERLIVTDREAITSIIEDDAAAVTRDDWDAVARTIDDAYEERGRDKAALLAWARGLWRLTPAKPLVIDVGDIRVDGDRAAARVIVRPGSRLSGLAFPGRVEFVRRSDGWKVDGIASDDPSLVK